MRLKIVLMWKMGAYGDGQTYSLGRAVYTLMMIFYTYFMYTLVCGQATIAATGSSLMS
jgi:hypothetical protein